MNVEDLVMTEEQLRQYTFERKLHPDQTKRDEQLQSLQRVIIHNAYTTDEAERLLRSAGVDAEKYQPLKSTEPHFYDSKTNTLHVVNSRGVIRAKREKDLFDVLAQILTTEVPYKNTRLALQWNHYFNSPAIATHRFTTFAFNLVDRVFESINSIDRDIIWRQGMYVILGPHKSLPETETPVDIKDDFLNYKILKIGNKILVSFDYIFADQAQNVLGQIYSQSGARFPGIDVKVFHYGKVGILDPNLQIGQICIPIAALDEEEIQKGKLRRYDIDNQLSTAEESAIFSNLLEQQIFKGITVNTTSVLRQTKSSLQKALEAGGHFLDMEWVVMASLNDGFHSKYPDVKSIEHYFAGIASDKPLEGLTLGDTEYPQNQEEKVASAFLKRIEQMP